MQLAWGDIGDAQVEEGRFSPEQRGGQRAHPVRVRPVAAEAGNQGITAGLQVRMRERIRRPTEQGRHFDGRRPLQNRGSPIEAKRSGGRTETGVERAVVTGGHLPEVGAAQDQILRTGPQLPDDHQPAHQAAL